MKIENYKRVQELMKSIEKDQKLMEKMSSYRESSVKVIITHENNTLVTIGIGDYEHLFTDIGTAFIDDCKAIIAERIEKQSEELEKL